MTRAFAIPTDVTAARPYAVAYTYANGYLRTVSEATNPYQPVPLATDIRYDRHGRVSQVTHGNGVVEQVGAGSYGMARPSYHRTQGALGARGASGDWSSGTYSYDGAGNVKAMGSSRFAYDALSRLTEGRVVANGSTYTQTVQFDLFGNITANVTTTFGSRATPTQTWSNHLSSGTYNPAGSLTSWNLWSYDWDPVEMMKRRSTAGKDWRHVYTAGDERFWNVNISDWKTSDFALRDLDGRVLRVYEAGEGKWSRFTDYVWRGDALLARDFSYTRPEAFHLDHLGTPRLLTNHRAERLAQPNYYPFGEELTVNTQVAERLKFTGHERDTLGSEEVADDLDYMHARFANPITGRFLSVDPAQESAIPAMPQSWNRYGYGLGSPIKYVDPDGRAVACPTTCAEVAKSPSWAWMLADPGLAVGPVAVVGGGRAATLVIARAAMARNALRVGRAGEVAIRSVFNIGSKGAFFVPGTFRIRIPDGVNRALGTLSEVKNVSHQGLTRQLQDELAIAEDLKLRFVLYTRKNTTISPQLQELVDDGRIILIKYIREPK